MHQAGLPVVTARRAHGIVLLTSIVSSVSLVDVRPLPFFSILLLLDVHVY